MAQVGPIEFCTIDLEQCSRNRFDTKAEKLGALLWGYRTFGCYMVCFLQFKREVPRIFPNPNIQYNIDFGEIQVFISFVVNKCHLIII